MKYCHLFLKFILKGVSSVLLCPQTKTNEVFIEINFIVGIEWQVGNIIFHAKCILISKLVANMEGFLSETIWNMLMIYIRLEYYSVYKDAANIGRLVNNE